MKVTEVPAQTVVAEAVIVTLTGSNGFTVMVTVLDVAGFPVVQVALDVNPQEIMSPFAGTNVYDALVAPVTLVPFSFH